MYLTIIEPMLRTTLTFLIVLTIARILGKKQISQLTFFDYVVGTAIGSLSASAMSNSAIPLATDLICFVTWALLILGTHVAALHSAPARKMLAEEPKVVIQGGKILEQNLRNSHYSINDLLMQLRAKEVFDPGEVDIGILEPSGELSILKKAEYKTVTAKDLNIASAAKNAGARYCTGQELIMNGEILEANLSTLGISKEWLQNQLHIQGVINIQKITVAAMTPSGKLYIDMEVDLDRAH